MCSGLLLSLVLVAGELREVAVILFRGGPVNLGHSVHGQQIEKEHFTEASFNVGGSLMPIVVDDITALEGTIIGHIHLALTESDTPSEKPRFEQTRC